MSATWNESRRFSRRNSKKKSADLDRAEKRYKSLITVKPAFMEEYERLEQELEAMYQIYV